jgi:chemotaxis protein CheD
VSLMTVDIADLKTSADPDAVIVTYALGSCIAVIVYDPVRKVGGMIHYMLPMSETSPEKAKERPAMFADTGIPLLFHTMYEMGCKKTDLIVKAAGGRRALRRPRALSPLASATTPSCARCSGRRVS